jgi:hypothetical protein
MTSWRSSSDPSLVIVLVLAFAAAVVVGPLAAIAPTWRLPVALPALSDLPAAAGVGRSVRVGVTDRQDVLATFGVVSPTVLLPAASRGWSSERLRVVLLHELAHIKRTDWTAQLFAEAVCASRGELPPC